MKSDIEIQKFVYHKIKGTSLEQNVSGKLSDRGRPNKSDKYHTVPSKCSQKTNSTGIPFEDGHTEHFINNKLYIEINNE